MCISWGQTLNNKNIIRGLSNYPTNQLIYPSSLEGVLSSQRSVCPGKTKSYQM